MSVIDSTNEAVTEDTEGLANAEPPNAAPSNAEPSLEDQYSQPEFDALDDTEPEIRTDTGETVADDSAAPEGGEEQPVELDPGLLADAHRLGYTIEQAKSYGTNEQLQDALLVLNQRLASMGELQFSQPQPSAQQPTGAAIQSAQRPEQPTVAPELAYKVSQELRNADDFDPKMVGEFQRLADHVGGQVGPVAETVNALVSAVQGMQQQYSEFVVSQMDDYFSSMGPEWSELFGKGAYVDLPQNSPQRLAREAVDQKAARLAKGYTQSSMGRPSLPKLLEWSVRMLHIDKYKEMGLRKVKADLDKRKGSRAMRPTGRRTKPVDSEETTEEAFDDLYKEKGWGSPDQVESL